YWKTQERRPVPRRFRASAHRFYEGALGMTRLTSRTSTIFIATARNTRVYRSMEEVPPPLRRKLRQTTRGLNSATILIADRRGREELVRALQGQASELHSRLVETLKARQVRPEQVAPSRPASIRLWLEMLLPAAASVSLWLFLRAHF
ncbi:MAG: hypothetical protein ACRD4O_15685, partial [Bryobacteraceae bacterium]